jgi:hypothetical protein
MDTFSLHEAFYTRDLEKHANKHDAMRVLSHISDQWKWSFSKSMNRRTN